MKLDEHPKATDELRFRVSPHDKDLIARAASIEGVSVTDFLRAPAVDRGRDIVERASLRQVTLVAPAVFDSLMASLDIAEPLPAALRAAATELLGLDLD